MANPSIETSIDIAAPPEAVWTVLADLPRFAEWNPFIVAAQGRIAHGERLDIEIRPPNGSGMRFKPVVLDAAPGQRLVWRGRVLLPGLFDGRHWFRLEAIPGGTRLHHGEEFSGIFARFMQGAMLARTQAGFMAMNKALKARCEGDGI